MHEESSCSEEEDDESLSGGEEEGDGEVGRGKAASDAKPAGATVTAFGQYTNRGGNARLKNQQICKGKKARNDDDVDDDDEDEEDLDTILFLDRPRSSVWASFFT